MARKNTNRYELATAQSLTTSFSTSPTMITYMDNCSYQINIATSNSIGTFSVEGSNDFQAANGTLTNPHAGNWVALPLGGSTAAPVANAANDTIIINLNQLPFNAIRISYTASTPGTGTCDIWVLEKQIGG